MTEAGLIRAGWDVPPFVHAGYTLRQGGVSAGCYGSLNLALHVGDDRDLVLENRSIAVRKFALPADPVYVTQVHGTDVLWERMPDRAPPRAMRSLPVKEDSRLRL